MPLCEYMLCDSGRGSGPKGANDLCSGIFEDLGLKVSVNNGILASMLGLGIRASRVGFEPRGWDVSLWLGFEPQGWDLSLKAEI